MTNLSNDNILDVLKEMDKPVLIDMYADWCGPCRMIEPIVEEIAKEYDGKLEVLKVNVDENPQSAAYYSVRSIPTLIVVNENGQTHKMQTGAVSKNVIIGMFESLIK